MVEKMREKFKELNKNENLALHLYELFSNLDGIEKDEYEINYIWTLVW